MNQPVNLVFGAYWSTDRDPTRGLSYINNVYQVIVVDEIIVDLYTPSNLVDLETSLWLYANGTSYASTGSQSGLYFRWLCPEEFQSVCDQFEGLPIM